MKKKSMIIIVFLISITLVNAPLDILGSISADNVSADSGEGYPFQPTDDIIIEALDYLRRQQATDGNIGGFSISSWAAMAISAAEEDPYDCGRLVEYLRNNADHLDENKATDWERQTLAIVACDENPKNFGGIDYLAKIESFYDGEQIDDPANLYDDFFGVLALISGGIDKDKSIIQNILNYIKEKQKNNGGWGDVDSTAAAIMALITAGENSNSGCITDALSFMKTTQVGSGGFQSWGTANAASTAWGVNAIIVTGGDPTSSEWKINGNSPIDFLLNLQQDNGCFNWAVDQNINPEWMTSYVIPALLGKPYPVKIYEFHDGENEGNNDRIKNTVNNNGRDDDNGNEGNNAGEDDWIGNVRIEGQTNTIWKGEVCFSDSMVTALNDSSGEMEEYFIPHPSVLGALDEASQQGGFSYFVIYYPSWNAFYVKTIAGESEWWHYWVNYILPMVGAGAYELTEDDEEVLWGYLEDWYAHALRITIEKHIVNKSEEFTVSIYNETMSPVKDAVVYVDSMGYMTDENGNITIQIDTAGYYEIYAEKDGYVRSEKVTVQVKKRTKMVKLEDNALYLLNRKTKIPYQKILIIGHIDIKVKTTDDVKKVEFYINDKLEYVDNEQPFKWRLNEKAFFKKATIKVKTYTDNNDVILKIQKIIQHIDSISENHHRRTAFNLIKTYLKDLELSLLELSDIDEKEVVIFNLFPRLHW